MIKHSVCGADSVSSEPAQTGADNRRLPLPVSLRAVPPLSPTHVSPLGHVSPGQRRPLMLSSQEVSSLPSPGTDGIQLPGKCKGDSGEDGRYCGA